MSSFLNAVANILIGVLKVIATVCMVIVQLLFAMVVLAISLCFVGVLGIAWVFGVPVTIKTNGRETVYRWLTRVR